MTFIITENLQKIYPVAVKEPGLKGTINHFFKRTYKEIKAVENVSFTIEPGEIVGFLGPNGAGKTTTLKMLTGLIYPSGGKVIVAGHTPYKREKSFLQKITLVMGQKQQLIWDLPALDSLKVNAAVYGISEQQFSDRLDELTVMLGLENKLNQPVRKLSLGERMKAELLAALIHRPQLLFLDEPTLGLDVNAQVAVRDFLREYNQKYQATIILTSHYMADITALCERVLLIYGGQLIYDGKLEQLLDRFAPYREVQIDLDQPVKASQISDYGEIESISGRTVKLLVKREQLTSTISKILTSLNVTDLTITDPPIEEVIARIFKQGEIN
jgi:ABC-2 type transport system ATP-binding protein